MPRLTAVAGQNVSGKSTLTAMDWFSGRGVLIDPDAIARRLNPERPAEKAISAARETIIRCNLLLALRSSFTLETTLAGNGAMSVLRRAKSLEYKTELVYVCMSDVELHIERVRLRATQGGHDIPDSDFRRRYQRSRQRAAVALSLTDTATVFDNSGESLERMLMLEAGLVVWRAERLPGWVQELVAQLD